MGWKNGASWGNPDAPEKVDLSWVNHASKWNPGSEPYLVAGAHEGCLMGPQIGRMLPNRCCRMV